MRVKIGDVVDKIVGDEDRFNTFLEYYIGGEHIESDRIKIYKKGLLNSDKGKTLGYQFHYPFQDRDVLFMTKNPYLRKCGMVDFAGICSIATFVMRSKDESILLQEYLALVMQTDDVWNYLEANKSGSVNYFITWKTLEKYEFELPGIEEQQRIIDIAWQFENTRAKYEELLIKNDQLVKSQFIEMFGELGKDDKGWGLTTLGECCELNPKRPRDINDELLVSFVPMPAVSEDGKIDCSDIKPYREVRKGFTYFAENDVLFAKITPCMENGKGAVAKGLEGGIGSGSTEFHVLRPIPGKSNPYWLYILTMFESFRVGARKVMTGTGGQLRVPSGYLNDYSISLPPIELQERFEEIVHQSDKSKFEIESTKKELIKAFKAFIKENVN